MKINAAGLAIIKFYESCKLTAYLCPANVWTIGYGSTGPHVYKGLTITLAEAERLLSQDIAVRERALNRKLADLATSQNQFSAMLSLAYNIGLKNFYKSPVLTFHREGDFATAASSFRVHNHSKGVVLKGLVTRRKTEAELYSKS